VPDYSHVSGNTADLSPRRNRNHRVCLCSILLSYSRIARQHPGAGVARYNRRERSICAWIGLTLHLHVHAGSTRDRMYGAHPIPSDVVSRLQHPLGATHPHPVRDQILETFGERRVGVLPAPVAPFIHCLSSSSSYSSTRSICSYQLQGEPRPQTTDDDASLTPPLSPLLLGPSSCVSRFDFAFNQPRPRPCPRLSSRPRLMYVLR
jgi:hypothetical protein